MINYNDNDIFKSNHYIEHFNECYDILSANNRFNYITVIAKETPKKEKKKGFFDKIFNKEEESHDDYIRNNILPNPDEESIDLSNGDIATYVSSKTSIEKEFDNKIDEFMKKDFEPVKDKPSKNIIRDFEQMWYFAQFVRYAEKVIFYDNDTDKPLFVDSPLDEDRERIFVISKGNYIIKFKLQWIYDSTAKQMLKVINIKIDRNFGKEMSNEYIIVDGNVKLKDVSDFTLISIINSILYDATLDTYKLIMDKLFTFFEERMTYPCLS